MNKDEAVALLKGPYGREIGDIAGSYTSAIFWFSGPPTEVIGHGCIFFLDCGIGPFGVTADHVYAGYLERKRLNPLIKCQVGQIPFVPEDRIIDRDNDLDLATFVITEKEIGMDGKLIHRVDPSKWPPKPPEVGKGIFFAGYPKEHRMIRDSKEVMFGTYVGVLTATAINEQYIVCQYDRDEIVSMFGNQPLPERQSLGGMSGAPLWALVQTGIFSWRLGGIIYEFSSEYDLLYARRPDRLLTNGRISR